MIGITIHKQNATSVLALVILIIFVFFDFVLIVWFNMKYSISLLFLVLFFRRFVGYAKILPCTQCYQKQFVDSTTTMYVSIYFVWRSLFVFLSISLNIVEFNCCYCKLYNSVVPQFDFAVASNVNITCNMYLLFSIRLFSIHFCFRWKY